MKLMRANLINKLSKLLRKLFCYSIAFIYLFIYLSLSFITFFSLFFNFLCQPITCLSVCPVLYLDRFRYYPTYSLCLNIPFTDGS